MGGGTRKRTSGVQWRWREGTRGIGVEVGIIVRRQHQGNERKSWQGKEQWTLVFFGIVIFSI